MTATSRIQDNPFPPRCAEVAKLADALDSGSVSILNPQPSSAKLKTAIEAALRCAYELVLLRPSRINLGQFLPKRNTQANTWGLSVYCTARGHAWEAENSHCREEDGGEKTSGRVIYPAARLGRTTNSFVIGIDPRRMVRHPNWPTAAVPNG